MKKKLSLSLAALMLASALITALPLTVFAADPALQKTDLEARISRSLEAGDCAEAQRLCDKLAVIIEQMQSSL